MSKHMRNGDKYPTGQQYRVKAMSTESNIRIKKARKECADYVFNFLSSTPKTVEVVNGNGITANKEVYRYELQPDYTSNTTEFIRAIVNENLFGNKNGTWTLGWWANIFTKYAAEDGFNSISEELLDKVTSLNKKSLSKLKKKELKLIQDIGRKAAESTMLSPRNVSLINRLYARNFESMSGLSDGMVSSMRASLANGVASGKSAREVAREIVGASTIKGENGAPDVVGIDERRALRIARTEMNTAYNMARLDKVDEENSTLLADSEFEARVMHRSAFLSSTRMDHGRRHGTVCTPEQQNTWWDTVASGGRINCYCTTVTVLYDKEAGEYVDDDAIKRYNEKREEFYKVKETDDGK